MRLVVSVEKFVFAWIDPEVRQLRANLHRIYNLMGWNTLVHSTTYVEHLTYTGNPPRQRENACEQKRWSPAKGADHTQENTDGIENAENESGPM